MCTIKIPALMIEQPIGQFYYGKIKAQDLYDISYSDVRRMEHEGREVEKYLGIQRPLSKKRVREISSYISTIDSTFPNSIIVAINESDVYWNNGFLEINFKEENKDKVAKILDGQHRLAGFNETNFEFEDYEGTVKPFEILVTVFVKSDMSSQAKIFSMVNQNQTKVNKSLVFDLESLAKSRSPWKTCHSISVFLNGDERSPFYRRIKRLGVKTRRGDVEPLTQAAFVDNLVKLISPQPQEDRNTFLAQDKGFVNFKKTVLSHLDTMSLIKYPFREHFSLDQDEMILKIVNNFFNAVANVWPNSWDKYNKDSTLNKTVGLIGMMRLLGEILRILMESNIEKDVNITSKEWFEGVLQKTNVSEDFFTQLDAVSKSGSKIYHHLKENLTIDDC